MDQRSRVELLKIHAPQSDERTTNQKVASSTLAGRTTFLIVYRHSQRLLTLVGPGIHYTYRCDFCVPGHSNTFVMGERMKRKETYFKVLINAVTGQVNPGKTTFPVTRLVRSREGLPGADKSSYPHARRSRQISRK